MRGGPRAPLSAQAWQPQASRPSAFEARPGTLIARLTVEDLRRLTGLPEPLDSQGNESRLTSQRPQYLQEVFWIPRGALAASLDGAFVDGLAHQIEGEVADHGHVLGTMTDTQA
jgi:hypothetical protein